MSLYTLEPTTVLRTKLAPRFIYLKPEKRLSEYNFYDKLMMFISIEK